MSLTVIWQGPCESLSVSAKVIRRADWARLVSSAHVLSQACEREAGSQERSQAIEKAAYERGHAVGVRLGREEGLLQVLGQLNEKQRFVERLNGELVNVVTHAVHGLLGEVSNDALLRAQVERSVVAARNSTGALMLVAIDRVDDARRLVADILGEPAPDWLRVQGDASLGACDIVIEAAGAIFDGRIHAQIDRWRGTIAELLGNGPLAAEGAWEPADER